MLEARDSTIATHGSGCAQTRRTPANSQAQLAVLEERTAEMEAEVSDLKTQPIPDQDRIDQLEAEIADNFAAINGLSLQIDTLTQFIDENC